jgi:hypothetical protein
MAVSKQCSSESLLHYPSITTAERKKQRFRLRKCVRAAPRDARNDARSTHIAHRRTCAQRACAQDLRDGAHARNTHKIRTFYMPQKISVRDVRTPLTAIVNAAELTNRQRGAPPSPRIFFTAFIGADACTAPHRVENAQIGLG